MSLVDPIDCACDLVDYIINFTRTLCKMRGPHPIYLKGSKFSFNKVNGAT